MSSHAIELNLNKARVKALSLVVLMVLSTTLVAIEVSASNSKQYPVTRNPLDLATGDFDCDGDDDIVTASEMGHFLSILWNDGGTYQDRDDIWVVNNQSRRAGFYDIADVGNVEAGDLPARPMAGLGGQSLMAVTTAARESGPVFRSPAKVTVAP